VKDQKPRKQEMMKKNKTTKDRVAHDRKPPGASGDDPYAKDGSVVWDVTKAQVCVEQ
jgi:hypothetical protein